MANVISSKGFSSDTFKRKIKDMNPGEVGYTVEWAIQNGNLDEEYTIFPDKGGTGSVRVTCIAKGKYEIEYEASVYKK